jgi:hypothetical protein
MCAARVRSTENYGWQILGRAEAGDDFIEQLALGDRYPSERYGGGRHGRSVDYDVPGTKVRAWRCLQRKHSVRTPVALGWFSRCPDPVLTTDQIDRVIMSCIE